MSTPSPTCGGTGDILPRERARASFNVEALHELLNGKRMAGVDKFRKLFQSEIFTSQENDGFRSYEDLFERKLKRVAEAMRVTRANPSFMALHMGQKVRMGDMFNSSHLGGIHFSMFLTYIRTQASKEQQEVWLDAAEEARYFGAYAQTELGHGSNVRGLETTATFDKETDEFVVHSPTLTSLKWWPTGMYACTHGAVFAQLIIDGVNYGTHAFMVQFRDTNGCLMPGVEVGEIGPKIAPLHTNIGYARFTQVRVPRFNLFARSQQVTREGKYIAAPKKLSKFKYISMMSIRVAIVGIAHAYLARAATIAIRYSAVRQQGFRDTQSPDALSTGEHFILDYQVQQYRLFRALSLAFTFYWNGRFIADYLSRVQAAIMKGDESGADEMPELHATCAGLKVWSSVWAHIGIEDCRKACGGQGFLYSSGLPELTNAFAENVTVEGEQVIMSLQVARFLFKAVADVRAGRQVAGSVTYLQDPPLGPIQLGRPGQYDILLGLLKDRARRWALKAEAAMSRSRNSGMGFDAALDSCATLAYKTAECHSAYVMARNNYSAVGDYVTDPPTKLAMMRLFELMCLQQIRENSGDWMGVLTEQNIDDASDRINTLLKEIRPDAVGLVDAFGYRDSQLQSTLGRYDGNVYEAIYAEAKRNPLNATPKMVGWDDLKTVLDMNILEEGMKTQRAKL